MTNHVADFYFWAIDVTGINRKDRSSLKYPDLELALRPVARCDEIQYLSLVNFLTSVTKISTVFQKMMKKKWFLTMMFHILFLKRS